MLVGAHVPAAHPLAEAEARNADVVQMFLSNPQSWKKPAPRADAAALAGSKIPIYVHSPYLINVCTDNNRVRIPSRKILQDTCDAAAEIGAVGVVVHGGHVTGEGDVTEGYLRWRKALESVDTDVPILIENTAAGDKAVARRVDQLTGLWDEIGEFGVGFVLDTCHAWAGGEPIEELVGRVREATGRIDLVHLNDSRDPFDSRRDRHANIGRGEIDEGLLTAVVAAVDCPIIVETPGEADEQGADIAWARAVVGVPRP
ncbi:MAG TPA: deoxyribonuclease IV [Acidimicrobiia bacterium]|nr:deoxyribonuclease IV [Acidimicrobiia bacterium]